jgi:serine/threonine protein kinase/formylglycine-generating enzyme required for sulfatase activity
MTAERAAAQPPSSPAPPTQIGPYRILERLGEGGMGTVFLAEQQQPVKRRVALKLVKPGMDSKAVIARFQQEEQALALMQHDGIARVYDCGTSDAGQPFFVMEYVPGIPLTTFCDQRRLSLQDRLLLLQQVCAAVTHAHQKGVVHRDLKPGNVLVCDVGGKAQCKIIDFGLAKALGPKLVDATLFTEAGQIVGTPEYMAPEQAYASNQDIDTRADVYSIGVLLYEILVGTLPFPPEELRRAGILEAVRILREVEPPRPSTQLSAGGDAAAGVAQARRTSMGVLSRALRYDLDWVVLKALEKDRNRRYETANALAADLQRFLDHEPLVAGPPSAGYRLKKLLRRYRGQVLAVSAVLLTAIAGAVVAFDFAIKANDRAEENGRLAREKGEALDGFRLLSNVVQLEDAKRIAATLYPAFPDRAPAMRDWLRDHGQPLADRLPALARALTELRRKAMPQPPAQQDAARRTHPRFEELQRLQAQLRAADVRAGRAQPALPALDEATQAMSAKELNDLAWPLVDPGQPVYGREAEALALARLALKKIDGGDASFPKCCMLDTLAWACHENGLDDEALRHSNAAHDACPEKERAGYAGYTQQLERSIADQRGAGGEPRFAAPREWIAALDVEVATQCRWEFADGSDRFLHEMMSRLVADLVAFTGDRGEYPAVQARLREAESVRHLTIDAHRAQWDAAIAAVAAEPLYRGLRIAPQLGLVPLGPDPESKLWEFVHLGSGAPGKELPPRDEQTHRLKPTGDMGVVFVLLPRGTFTMGAQKDDPGEPNFDLQTRVGEQPPHGVALAPFFLGKYEITRAQWLRLSNGDQPFWYHDRNVHDLDPPIGPSHPADSVSWTDADLWLVRNGLCLPTEAQWEYGCRGGTTTPWWTGKDVATLAGAANVLDQVAGRHEPQWGVPDPFEDGYTGPSPVGSFAPNPFGLFDVHGNVWEWCQDEFGFYSDAVRPGDGLNLKGDGTGHRVYRGGSFFHPGVNARSATRNSNAPSSRLIYLGLRAARAVQP